MKTLICLDTPCRTLRCIAIAVVMLVSFALGGIENAQADPFLDERVEFNGGVFFLEQKVPAAVIGVVRNGEISICGFGERASKGSPEPDGDTVLRIGSITKAFTGQVLAQLVAANSVELIAFHRSRPNAIGRYRLQPGLCGNRSNLSGSGRIDVKED
jgi:CubicO group peptidase (beta-lactamase class C family)